MPIMARATMARPTAIMDRASCGGPLMYLTPTLRRPIGIPGGNETRPGSSSGPFAGAQLVNGSRRAYLRFAPVGPDPGMACWPPWVCLVSLSPGRVVDDLAGAFAPPPLLSDDVLRLEAPAPVVPPVLEESMLDPVLDAPAPCANAEGGNARAATSPARTSAFMSAPLLDVFRWRAEAKISARTCSCAEAEMARQRRSVIPNSPRAGRTVPALAASVRSGRPLSPASPPRSCVVSCLRCTADGCRRDETAHPRVRPGSRRAAPVVAGFASLVWAPPWSFAQSSKTA